MKKKHPIILMIVAVLLVVVIGGIYFLSGDEFRSHSALINKTLKTFYEKSETETLDMLEPLTTNISLGDLSVEDLNNDLKNVFENIYMTKYRNYLTKDAYEILVANRIILEPEEILKDFQCTLKLSHVEVNKSADTFEGYPTYDYEAKLKVILSTGQSQDIIETGTVNFTKEYDAWKIDLLNVKRYSLYDKVEYLVSD